MPLGNIKKICDGGFRRDGHWCWPLEEAIGGVGAGGGLDVLKIRARSNTSKSLSTESIEPPISPQTSLGILCSVSCVGGPLGPGGGGEHEI